MRGSLAARIPISITIFCLLAASGCVARRMSDLPLDLGALTALVDLEHPTLPCRAERPHAEGCHAACKPCRLWICVDGKWVVHVIYPPENPSPDDRCNDPLSLCPIKAGQECPLSCFACTENFP